MKHLTEQEMDAFISLGEAAHPDFALAGRVNAHLMECRQCRERMIVRQDAYDEAHSGAKNTKRVNVYLEENK